MLQQKTGLTCRGAGGHRWRGHGLTNPVRAVLHVQRPVGVQLDAQVLCQARAEHQDGQQGVGVEQRAVLAGGALGVYGRGVSVQYVKFKRTLLNTAAR
jgi:hypothetical protein